MNKRVNFQDGSVCFHWFQERREWRMMFNSTASGDKIAEEFLCARISTQLGMMEEREQVHNVSYRIHSRELSQNGKYTLHLSEWLRKMKRNCLVLWYFSILRFVFVIPPQITYVLRYFETLLVDLVFQRKLYNRKKSWLCIFCWYRILYFLLDS